MIQIYIYTSCVCEITSDRNVLSAFFRRGSPGVRYDADAFRMTHFKIYGDAWRSDPSRLVVCDNIYGSERVACMSGNRPILLFSTYTVTSEDNRLRTLCHPEEEKTKTEEKKKEKEIVDLCYYVSPGNDETGHEKGVYDRCGVSSSHWHAETSPGDWGCDAVTLMEGATMSGPRK